MLSHRRPHRAAALCVLAVALAACASLPPGEPIDLALREAIHRVPVAAADASIVVTSFRPRGAGPFPWLVLSHGTATAAAANRAVGRYRPLTPVREWVRRGYAVVVPVRRGYVASGGDTFGDSYGTCSRPDFRRAGEGGALDLLATVDTASKRPEGLAAVLAFAPGRGGRPGHAPGRAVRARAPGRAARLDHAADRGAGAVVLRGQRRVHRPEGADALVRRLPLGRRARTPAVAKFFGSQGVALPF